MTDAFDPSIERLLSSHRDDLRRWVDLRMEARLRVRIDASDVVQDVMLEAAQRYSAFRTRTAAPNARIPFAVWLRSLARDRLIDLHRWHLGRKRRSAWRETAMPQRPDVGSGLGGLAADQSTPSQTTMREERGARLNDALARLSGTDRLAIELRDFVGCSNRDVAQRLGLSEAAASARYMRALERLGDLLSEDDCP